MIINNNKILLKNQTKPNKQIEWYKELQFVQIKSVLLAFTAMQSIILCRWKDKMKRLFVKDALINCLRNLNISK